VIALPSSALRPAFRVRPRLLQCVLQAIGSGAVYAPAKLYATPDRFPEQFHNDQDFFLRVSESDPLVDWVDQGDWGPDNKCAITGTAVAQLRLPHDFTTASDGHPPGQVCPRAFLAARVPTCMNACASVDACCLPSAPLAAPLGDVDANGKRGEGGMNGRTEEGRNGWTDGGREGGRGGSGSSALQHTAALHHGCCCGCCECCCAAVITIADCTALLLRCCCR
jgi:hypothetical protein